MKINKKEFFEALNAVKGAVSNNSPIPAMTGVLMEISPSSLVLTGTNSDVSIQVNVDTETSKYEASETEKVCLRADMLSNMISRSGETLEFKVDGSKVRLKTDGAKYTINGINAKDFPGIDFKGTSSTLKMNSAELLDMLEKVSFAASAKDTRPILTGINFSMKNGVLVALATDSYRLSRITSQRSETCEFNFTMPMSTYKLLKRVIRSDDSKEIDISVTDRDVSFRSNGVVIKSTLLDGGYPEVNRLIPSSFRYEVTLSKKELLNALQRGSIFKNDGIAVFKAKITNGKFSLSTENKEFGDFGEELTAKTSGGDFSLAMSGNYAMDALSAIKSDEVIIDFVGDMKPFILKGSDDARITELLLPIRTYN